MRSDKKSNICDISVMKRGEKKDWTEKNTQN